MAKYVQAKKQKNQKKEISPAFLRFKLFFRSLIKNDAAVEGGRFSPWWTSLLIALSSVVVALTPTFVQIGKTHGNQILKGDTYSTDVGLVAFSEALKEHHVSLTIEKNTEGKHRLLNAADEATTKLVFTENLTLDTQSYDYFLYKTSDDVAKFKVFYFVEGPTSDFKILREYLRNLKYSEKNPIEGQIRPVSYLILTDVQLSGANYKFATEMNGTTTASAVSGDYSLLPTGYSLATFATKSATGENIVTLKENAATYEKYVEGVLSNWSNFYNEAYKPVKKIAFWTLSGTYAGAYVVIVLFLGLVLFLITRGKYSVNRDWKFFQAMGVGAWMSFTPALLTLLVGLFSPGYAAMGFIMLNSFRVMWFSMKAMRESTPPTTK
ncbi:MAG: hypothetical protein ACOX3K_01655 [Bacilli bacterium]